MSRSNFLTDNQGHPIRVFHGTGTRFDHFLPLSHFTTDKRIAALYANLKRQPIESINQSSAMLSQPSISSDEIIIPAYLKLSHPFESPEKICPDSKGATYSYLSDSKQVCASSKESSNPDVDFIFRNPFEITNEQVVHELMLDSLYFPSSNMQLNRSHLVKQRQIQFWESFGYDGFKYMTEIFYPAYVVFRSNQVYRLDRKDCNYEIIPNHPENKLELKKIHDGYVNSYKPHKISFEEQMERVVAQDFFKRITVKM